MVDLAKGRRVQAKWKSSGRPIFVRTVFVDGLRHAILSADDPVIQFVRTPLRREASTVGSSQNVAVNSSDADAELACCLVKLALERKTAPIRKRSEISYIRPTNTESSSSDDCEDYSSTKSTSKFSRRGSSISERVLQWLDLAGKNVNISCCDRNPRRWSSYSTSSPPSRRRRSHVVTSAPARTRLRGLPPLSSPPPPPSPLSLLSQTATAPSSPSSESTSAKSVKLSPIPINKRITTPRPQLHIFLPWPVECTDDTD